MRPDRRTVLRGFGTALALPWMESMHREDPELPTRLAYVYAPNGIHMPDWYAEQDGGLGRTLEPLADLRADLDLLRGLTHDKGRANGDGPGDHARASATWLTGVQPLKTDGRVMLGISADQVAAASIGDRTKFRSLVVGCDSGLRGGQCDSGYACAYSGNISWEGPETPAGKEVNPRRIFDRLFRGGEDAEDQAARLVRLRHRRSLLDFVARDARSLSGRLGSEDRGKLDEYLTGIRELERRLDDTWPDRVESVGDELRPPADLPDLGVHARLLADLVVLAFRSDVTRVATIMLLNEGSNRSYPDLGVHGGHHALSHHRGEAAKEQQIQRINRFHVELFAHFVRGLKEVQEHDRSLLDASMVVFGSGLSDGNRHHHHDLPVLLAGGGNGTLSPGGIRVFEPETPMMNLHLALLGRMGAPIEALGDSTGVLELS